MLDTEQEETLAKEARIEAARAQRRFNKLEKQKELWLFGSQGLLALLSSADLIPSQFIVVVIISNVMRNSRPMEDGFESVINTVIHVNLRNTLIDVSRWYLDVIVQEREDNSAAIAAF